MDRTKKPVTMCVCTDTLFEEIALWRPECLEEIEERWGCGRYCGTCAPYLARMLETGEVDFDVI